MMSLPVSELRHRNEEASLLHTLVKIDALGRD